MSAVHVANQKGLHICSVWYLLWQKSRFCQSTMVMLQLQRQPFSRTKCSTLGDDHQPIRGLYAQNTTLGPEPYQGPAPPRPRHAAAVVPAPSHRHQAARAAWPRNTAESVMGLREMAAWHIFTPQVDRVDGRNITTVYWNLKNKNGGKFGSSREEWDIGR